MEDRTKDVSPIISLVTWSPIGGGRGAVQISNIGRSSLALGPSQGRPPHGSEFRKTTEILREPLGLRKSRCYRSYMGVSCKREVVAVRLNRALDAHDCH